MDGMDEFRDIFFTECTELLTDMEARLLALQEGTIDQDALNAIFRCAHSIKGGSGAFGMDAIMQFTHVLEALLDLMRDGQLVPDRESIDVLLKANDVLTRMLDMEQQGKVVPEGFGADVADVLLGLCEGRFAGSASEQEDASANGDATADSAGKDNAKAVCFDITFYPHSELFASGNEPMLILRELAELGWLDVEVDTSRIAPLAELEETQCFLGWKLVLFTEASRADVEEVFEFVQHISDITITEAASVLKQAAASAPTAEEAIAEPLQEEAEHHEAIEIKKEEPIEIGKSAPFLPQPATKPEAAVTVKEEKEEGMKATVTTSIRVDLDKVDRLVNMVGELVITEAMLRSQVRQMGTDAPLGLQRGVDEMSQHTRELQEAVMAVRMQPVKSVFSRMPRIVRDTSATLEKDIQLILSGENTEVDKTVIEQLGDPLTHMIRNSVDHGIENPQKRLELGKPAQGTIHLSAYHRSGRIIIEIEDDGAGINREKVLAKAKEKGLVPADANLSDEECDHLIFMPGFSTAEQVTSVSGRGVGMDVVKKNIEALGGFVRVTNRPGKGSVFTVSLPLTLAILDGMIVRVGKENYVIPITSIIEMMRPLREDVRHIPGRGDTVNVRGDVVQLLCLHQIFGVGGVKEENEEMLVVLVESGHQKMGLVVDELIGQQQVVIKSLEANADPVKGISGATILGDGRVSLILEINELHQIQLPPRIEAA